MTQAQENGEEQARMINMTRRRKAESKSLPLERGWMVSTPIRLGEPPRFLARSNYHHDREDDAPTATTPDPRESPIFASQESAERGARRFSMSGEHWRTYPADVATFGPEIALAILEAAGLPGFHKDWRLTTEPGTIAARYDPARLERIRVTYSGECASATYHAMYHVLRRIYTAELVTRQHATHSEELAVMITGVLPWQEWEPRATGHKASGGERSQ